MTMENTSPAIPLPLEDDVLAYTQNKREQIVNSLFAKGVPQDTDTLKIALTTLDGMDKSALIVNNNTIRAMQDHLFDLVQYFYNTVKHMLRHKRYRNNYLPL